eukprot:SAG22_NODE_205_length_15308_cov_20.539023_3_plen_56_part_00
MWAGWLSHLLHQLVELLLATQARRRFRLELQQPRHHRAAAAELGLQPAVLVRRAP